MDEEDDIMSCLSNFEIKVLLALAEKTELDEPDFVKTVKAQCTLQTCGLIDDNCKLDLTPRGWRYVKMLKADGWK